MDKKQIECALLGCKYIVEYDIQLNSIYNQIEYVAVIQCQLDIYNRLIPIIIGIPKLWKIKLFDFYLVKDIPFIPHIEKNGKLCLITLDDVYIKGDFESTLHECIILARDLINDGLMNKNLNDFLDEFNSYVIQLKGVKNLDFVISNIQESKNIKYALESDTGRFFASDEIMSFQAWDKQQNTQRCGVYFFINSLDIILPPNYFENNIHNYFLNLWNLVEDNLKIGLCSKQRAEILIIFGIQQVTGNINFLGFHIQKPNIDSQRLCMDYKKIEPVCVSSLNNDILESRIQLSGNNIFDKSVVVIGCGSIGGYVIDSLLKSGCKNITLVDFDTMKAENLYRHVLGKESINKFKARALYDYAHRMPGVKLFIYTKKIEDAITNGTLDLKQYDYVISTIGNHSINTWINDYIIDNNIDGIVYYLWVEPLDIGCHVVRVDRALKGDYNSILNKETDIGTDLSSYVIYNNKFTKKLFGCSNRFMQYTSTISMECSIIFIKLLRRDLEGRLFSNIIASKKGDDYYIKKEGFFTSERYDNQIEEYVEIELSNFP